MTPAPSPLVAALELAVAVLCSLNAARALSIRAHGQRAALIDQAITQQSALMRALNAAYAAEQAKGAPHDP